jgi:4-amino-4-deoxy-L-arabinose transferase-like glycosyltransferase
MAKKDDKKKGEDAGKQEDTPVTSTAAMSREVADESGWLRRIAGLHRVPNADKLAYTFLIAVAAGITLPLLGSIGYFDPWETHYAEVARQMAVRDDYIYPYWKNAYFFSKPVLIFWIEAVGYRLIGAHTAVDALPHSAELVGRLPIALVSLATLTTIFFTVRQFVSTRAGVLSGVVLSTFPFWAFISRQAITDMLYVGPMSMAICLLALAFFDDGNRERLKQARIPLWLILCFAVGLVPQLWEIGRTGAFLNRAAFAGSEVASRLVFSALLCGVAVGFLAYLWKKGKDPLIHGAAFLTALATLGKGPHALLFLGLVYFLYFVISGDWRFLRRKAMWTTAIVLYLGVALPWYIVMALFDGRDESRKTWVGRFIMWDLLGRIGGGVHGDRGTFEYYVRYFSFGAFPWIGAVPVALFDAASEGIGKKEDRTPQQRFTLLLVVWAVALFVFFTATTTKFHHYIFPVVVPSAILVGVWLDKLLRGEKKLMAGYVAIIVLGAILVGRDLAAEPWQLVDLFTYHYKSWKPDYYFPTDPNWHLWFAIGAYASISLLILGLFSDGALGMRERGKGGGFIKLVALPARFGRAALSGLERSSSSGFVLGSLLCSLAFTLFAVHVYFNNMSQHWSQRWIFETYYALRQPGEEIISWQMDWKGETFYGHNKDIQIKKSGAELKRRIERPGRDFVLVQTDRYNRIKSALGKEYEGKIKVVDRSNKKWFLVLVDE